MYYHTGICFPDKAICKIHKHSSEYRILEEELSNLFCKYSEILASVLIIICEWLLLPLEAFCEDFVNISFEKALLTY